MSNKIFKIFIYRGKTFSNSIHREIRGPFPNWAIYERIQVEDWNILLCLSNWCSKKKDMRKNVGLNQFDRFINPVTGLKSAQSVNTLIEPKPAKTNSFCPWGEHQQISTIRRQSSLRLNCSRIVWVRAWGEAAEKNLHSLVWEGAPNEAIIDPLNVGKKARETITG